MPMILFVCTANRYRSPIAAACFRKELELRKPGSDWQVRSAGTWTTDGLPAVGEAIRRAQQLGLDISAHRSQIIDSKLMKFADLILVMEQGHREALQSEFPESAYKVHLLSEAATGASYDIADPMTSRLDTNVAAEIDELIHDGFDRICALVGK